MKIALAQLNPVVADLQGNVTRIRKAATRAASQGADLVVFPELAVCGYPPKDLLLRESFVDACDAAVEALAADTAGGPALLVGHPSNWGGRDGSVGNVASLLDDGRVAATVHKQLLPTYDVFDEDRYFHEGPVADPVNFRGRKLGIHVCEDAWWGESGTFYHLDPDRPDPVAELAKAGAEVLINLSASPFEIDKPGRRLKIVTQDASGTGLTNILVNQVGGQDDLVFDGHSLVVDGQGLVRAELAGFEEDLRVVALDSLPQVIQPAAPPRQERMLRALVLGLRDYMSKCGFSACVLGLSGGIDSAVAAAIAAIAVGPENVHCLMMPSRYSSNHSVSDSVRMCEALGLDGQIVPIEEAHAAFGRLPVIGEDLSEAGGLPDQNLQARIRGACVMVRSNRQGWIALATGNKSELAVGYCTLYGDMAGGFAVLSDVYKRDVYALARHINEQHFGREVIPQSIIDKAPSAELAPDQFDADSLPPYPVLDAILERLIDGDRSFETLEAEFDPEVVAWVGRALDRNEFKRRQAAPGIKLSPRAFGSGRRFPMAMRHRTRLDD